PAERFDAVALDLARFQLAHVEPFARLVRAKGVAIDTAPSADAVPAVPSDVFRLARVAAHAEAEDARVFRTSGTTQGDAARGEHPLRTLETYAAGALAWGERMLWPDGAELAAIALAPPPGDAPDSSLSFMIDLFARALRGPATFHVRGGELDVEGVARACADARDLGRPALVMGTAFAFVHLVDAKPGAACALPPGSRAMQTGGFKGRSRVVAPEELREGIAAAFAMPAARVVGEYGMTELSSQLYEAAWSGPGVYWAPPWLRVRAADPQTLDVLPFGREGVARFVDLANVDSSAFVQTADVVRVHEDGAVELLGRAPGAPPRGCSLAIEAMLEGA
ncbi:MAG TPA: acyl-protein synthetase, partial [Minicystis sp.]|nr:acyl-protein synthetase [Minicystis sp.]